MLCGAHREKGCYGTVDYKLALSAIIPIVSVQKL